MSLLTTTNVINAGIAAGYLSSSTVQVSATTSSKWESIREEQQKYSIFVETDAVVNNLKILMCLHMGRQQCCRNYLAIIITIGATILTNYE